MRSIGFVIMCFSALCGVGFFLAFYLSVTLIDPPRSADALTPAIIARHWRTRPQARRTLALALVFLSAAAIVALLDALLR